MARPYHWRWIPSVLRRVRNQKSTDALLHYCSVEQNYCDPNIGDTVARGDACMTDDGVMVVD